jgi:hypothetical protein
MPTRPFDSSNPVSVLVPRLSRSLEMSSLSVPMPQRAERIDWGTSPSMEWPAGAVVDGRALGRGVCWALAIEGAGAICIYCLWQFWSLIR